MKHILIIITLAFTALWQCAAQAINESDWHVAFNNKVLKGRLEVVLSSGRADIVTRDYAVEVDKASKFKEFKPCFKHYLTNHVKGNVVRVPMTEWEIAIFLPIDNFKKVSRDTVWRYSRKSIYGK